MIEVDNCLLATFLVSYLPPYHSPHPPLLIPDTPSIYFPLPFLHNHSRATSDFNLVTCVQWDIQSKQVLRFLGGAILS